MRNIYKVLASQYDPIGFLTPYTTRAKVIVQQLWDKKWEWDHPLLPGELLTAWQDWENELPYLDSIRLPRCYVSPAMDQATNKQEVHVCCDTSQRAYGSVGYLCTEDTEGHVEVAFLTAWSRVAPKRQLSMPRLELCAALTGAQLSNVLTRELTVEISRVVMWTDSTTVLAWIQSDSCRFKVFAGTCIAEIQELIARLGTTWRRRRTQRTTLPAGKHCRISQVRLVGVMDPRSCGCHLISGQCTQSQPVKTSLKSCEDSQPAWLAQ